MSAQEHETKPLYKVFYRYLWSSFEVVYRMEPWPITAYEVCTFAEWDELCPLFKADCCFPSDAPF